MLPRVDLLMPMILSASGEMLTDNATAETIVMLPQVDLKTPMISASGEMLSDKLQLSSMSL